MSRKNNETVVLSVINVLLLYGLFIYFKNFGNPPKTPVQIQKAVDGLNILHFNNCYDVMKSARFLQKILEKTNESTLSLFSGDIIAPSTVSSLMKGAQMIPFMEYFDSLVAIPGNHEYDFGESAFDFFKSKTPSTQWILSNLKKKSKPTKTISDLEEYTIQEINGYKVGIFGLIDDDWLKTSKLNKQKYIYERFDIAAKRMSKFLKSNECDFIFALSHMSRLNSEKLLTEENDIDFIFGGHGHDYYVRRFNNKIFIRSGSDFDYFSQIHVLVSKTPMEEDEYCDKTCQDFKFELVVGKNEQVEFFNFQIPKKDAFLKIQIDKIVIENDDPEHFEMNEYIKSTVIPTVGPYLTPLAVFEQKMEAQKNIFGFKETAFGDLLADIIKIKYTSDFACLNAGMFKGQMQFEEKSIVRKNDLLKIFPSETDLFDTCKVTGRQLIEIIEESLAASPKKSEFFLSWSGLKFVYFPKNPIRTKLNLFTLKMSNGKPINWFKTYTLAFPSGLKHYFFGMKSFSGLKSLNKVTVDLGPVKLFENFAKKANNPDNIQEFKIFKQMMPDITLKELQDIKPNGKVAKLKLDSSGKLTKNQILERLSPAAFKRISYYSLAKTIVNKENNHVFLIDCKIDGRITVKNKTRRIV